MPTMTLAGDLKTLSDELLCERLQHRLARITVVLAQLRGRADDYARRGKVPLPLQHAIRDFNIERMAVEQQLEEL